MMLRVRPAQLTTTVVPSPASFRMSVTQDVGHPKHQLPSRHAAATGDAEPPVLLRGAGIQDDQALPPPHSGMKLSGLHFGDVVDHLHLLTEVLAGNVHAPLGGVTVGHPAVDATLQDRHVTVPHAFQGGGGQPGPPPVVVAHGHPGALEGHQVPHLELQQPPRQRAGTRDVAAVVLAVLPHVQYGKAGARLDEVMKVSGVHKRSAISHQPSGVSSRAAFIADR